MWTQEHCSRMFAISSMKGFSPASEITLLKVGSWSRGEQAATTMLSSFCSAMSSLIVSWPVSEQVNWRSRATSTPGRVLANSARAEGSRTPAMFRPQ